MPVAPPLLCLGLAVLGCLALGTATPANPVRACVKGRIENSTGAFEGNAACPAECAHCHESDPGRCPDFCSTAQMFCGCSEVIFKAVDAAKTCCDTFSGLDLVSCNVATGELEGVSRQLHFHYCSEGADVDINERVQWPDMAEIVSGALSPAGPAELKPAPVSLQEVSEAARGGARAYVGAHRLGAACVALLEDMEREHAEIAERSGRLGEAPDLHAVAGQIASRAAGVLGRELPALEGKVHRAMAVAWSGDGPGMDAEDVCEVVLKHHDSL